MAETRVKAIVEYDIIDKDTHFAHILVYRYAHYPIYVLLFFHQ